VYRGVQSADLRGFNVRKKKVHLLLVTAQSFYTVVDIVNKLCVHNYEYGTNDIL